MTDAARALATIAAQAAGVARQRRPAAVETKGHQDYVTDLDKALEEQIMSALEEAFPGIPALGEESLAPDERLPATALVVDPLDGTGNFIAGVPFTAVSIALIENGATQLAAVAAIQQQSVYSAALGRGALRDGERLAVPAADASNLIAISTGLLDRIGGTDCYAAVRKFGKLRNLGAQALQLCLAGDGALSLVASHEARLWDDAAGRLVATEAGMRYAAFAAAEDRDLPAAPQRSLCAHPAIWAEAERHLAPVLTA